MIKICRSLPMMRRVFGKNCGGFCSTMGNKASSLLKHSRFSEYMGLAEQLRKLEKEEEKGQKRQVRSSNFILVVCVAGLCSLALFVSADPVSSLRLLLLQKEMQLKMTKDQESKKRLLTEMGSSIKAFLEKRPHDYLEFVGSLKNIGKAMEEMPLEEGVQETLKQVYLFIFKRNYKAVKNKDLINALNTLVERCFVLNKELPIQLIHPLLEYGSTKQVYLAVKCISRWNKIAQLQPEQRQRINHNLQNQANLNHTYFSSIFEKILQHDVPHLSSKKQQQLAWQAYVRSQLNLV